MLANFYSMRGELQGQRELPEAIFGAKPNPHAMYEATRGMLANRREGTASTKERSAVRGGGRKPWRQKGTGRARAGSRRSPIWVGGGVVFGPHPRDYTIEIPKKVRHLALRSALSSKAGEERVTVLEDFVVGEPKTKEALKVLRQLKVGEETCLLLVDSPARTLMLATRNIPNLEVRRARDVTTYDVLLADRVLVTAKALDHLKEILG